MNKDELDILLPYQAEWIDESAHFAVCEKSRRIGLSWADAAESVMHAGFGKGHVYYQSFNQDMTQTYIQDCGDWAERLNMAASEIITTPLISNEREQVLRYRITFDCGKFIQAVPSNPRALRSKGKPGDRYVLDEAAFCDDLDALIKAATAITQWGGIVRIISTHNGEGSAFNRLVCAVREGKHPHYALHRITLDEAIAQGLARRVYSVTGKDWHDAWQWLRAAEHEQAGVPAHYADGLTYIGIDVARRQDLWVAVVLERVGDVLWVRELITRQGILEGVILSAPKRLDVATAFREVLEDGRIRIPTDEALMADLHSIKAETSITGAPRLVAERSGTDGHADRFWALALACAAAAIPAEHFAYEAVSSYYDADGDDDFYGNRYSIKAQRGLL